MSIKKRSPKFKRKKNESKFTDFGILITVFLILIILLMLFLIFYNSNKKITDNNLISEYDFSDVDFLDGSNIDDIYDVNSNIDVDKLNIYLEATDESWRAGDSEYKKLLDSLYPEDAKNLISGVIEYPEELTSVDIHGISLTVDDVLSDRYLEYLSTDSNLSIDQTDGLNLLETRSKSSMTGFSTLSFATDDGPNEYTDFDRKIGTNNKYCTTTSYLSNKYDYKYPYDPNDFFKTTDLPKFTCACISNSKGYSYGFEICENGKTRSFTIDEFYEYLSEKTNKKITHDTDKSYRLMKSCYPTKLKTDFIKNSAKKAKSYLDIAFDSQGVFNKHSAVTQNLETIGYANNYFDNHTKEQITNFLNDQIKNPHNYIFSCFANLNYPPEYKTEFELFFHNPPKNQKVCGSCTTFATVGLFEGYIYNKSNFKTKLNLSEQYLASQINNFGCSGAILNFYLPQLTLSLDSNKFANSNYKYEYLVKDALRNILLQKKISQAINNKKSYLYKITSESTVPFGLPETKENQDLKYEAMDACEFNSKEEYDNSAIKK